MLIYAAQLDDLLVTVRNLFYFYSPSMLSFIIEGTYHASGSFILCREVKNLAYKNPSY